MKNDELRAVIEHLEQERNLDKEALTDAIEKALASSILKMSMVDEVRVEIDRKSYQIRVFELKEVTEFVTSPDYQVDIDDAHRYFPDSEVGEEVWMENHRMAGGRIMAQQAKQAIMHQIREAEREKMFEEFKDRTGDLVHGTVRRFDKSDVIIELNGGEAVMPHKERVPTEEYQAGESLQCYIVSVQSKNRGPEILLSRSHPNFVRKLFEREVSEIGDGSVEIMGIAREAGFRSKVAVRSVENNIDPVGACVGMKGIRVRAIVRELNGEKVDIVRYHPDIKAYVANALAPAKLDKLEINEATHRIKVIVDEDQLSLAIGKKGQNARLTSKLTGWRIDIQKEEAKMNFEEKLALAVKNLSAVPGIDREIAEKLVRSGFLTCEGIMAAEQEDLAGIEGFSGVRAIAVKNAAESYYERIHGKFQS